MCTNYLIILQAYIKYIFLYLDIILRDFITAYWLHVINKGMNDYSWDVGYFNEGQTRYVYIKNKMSDFIISLFSMPRFNEDLTRMRLVSNDKSLIKSWLHHVVLYMIF